MKKQMQWLGSIAFGLGLAGAAFAAPVELKFLNWASTEEIYKPIFKVIEDFEKENPDIKIKNNADRRRRDPQPVHGDDAGRQRAGRRATAHRRRGDDADDGRGDPGRGTVRQAVHRPVQRSLLQGIAAG